MLRILKYNTYIDKYGEHSTKASIGVFSNMLVDMVTNMAATVNLPPAILTVYRHHTTSQ